MKNKAIRKKTAKVAGKTIRRRHVAPKRASGATHKMKAARKTARARKAPGANPRAVQGGIVEVLEVWDIESAGTEDAVNTVANIGPADPEESF
jgi:hypothetical protein